MAHFRTSPKWLRVRSAFDPRWVVAFLVGFVFSVAYYGLMIWAGLWLLRSGLALIWPR